MAIPLPDTILVGSPNQATGSDNLYDAFNKVNNNFGVLSNTASPYNNFIGGQGITINSYESNGTVDVVNNGVIRITAGTGITASSSNGNVILSVSGYANGTLVAGVTNVGVQSSTLTVSNSPIISSGTISINLPQTGVTAGQYIAPTMTVDQYGRITGISSTSSTGTVTSVAIVPGNGISVSGTNPITDSGSITINNDGVTKLNAGPGILLSSQSGEVTVSASVPRPGTVNSVEITSNSLVVTGSPITSSGTINIELAGTETLSNLTANYVMANFLIANSSLSVTGNSSVTGTMYANALTPSSGNLLLTGNVSVTGTIATGNATLSTLAVSGNANLSVLSITGNTSIGGKITVTGNVTSGNANLGNLASANYFSGDGSLLTSLTGANVTGQVGNALVASTVYSNAQPNITSVGTLASTTFAANANITMSGSLSQISGLNLVSSNNITVASNITVGNSTVGNIHTYDLYGSNTIVVGNTGYLLLNTVTNNNKFVGLQAPSSIVGSYIIWQLPNAEGSANSFLSTNGSGVMSFKQPASSSAPATSTSAGIAGQIAYDSTHIYVCIATNSWIRADAAAW